MTTTADLLALLRGRNPEWADMPDDELARLVADGLEAIRADMERLISYGTPCSRPMSILQCLPDRPAPDTIKAAGRDPRDRARRRYRRRYERGMP